MSSTFSLSAVPSVVSGILSGDMRAVLFFACVALLLLVFAGMLGALWHHRQGVLRQGAQPFHASAWVELVWSLIPIAIVVAMAWPAVRVVWARLVGLG